MHLSVVPGIELGFLFGGHTVRIVVFTRWHGSFVVLLLPGVEQVGKGSLFQFGQSKHVREEGQGCRNEAQQVLELKVMLPNLKESILTP